MSKKEKWPESLPDNIHETIYHESGLLYIASSPLLSSLQLYTLNFSFDLLCTSLAWDSAVIAQGCYFRDTTKTYGRAAGTI